MMQSIIKLVAPCMATLMVILAIGLLWPVDDAILGGDEEELTSTFNNMLYAVAVAGALVAGAASFLLDFFLNKQQEPMAGERGKAMCLHG